MDACRLRELLHYDPASGVFKWRCSPARQIKVGSVAGSMDRSGYLRIRVDGKLYRAARLAWLWVHGRWPDGDIDHINRVKSDDRIANLRDVSHQANCHNVALPFSHGSTGLLGAHRSGDRHAAKISVGGKSVWLGRYDTAEEAASVYAAAKRRLHLGVL